MGFSKAANSHCEHSRNQRGGIGSRQELFLERCLGESASNGVGGVSVAEASKTGGNYDLIMSVLEFIALETLFRFYHDRKQTRLWFYLTSAAVARFVFNRTHADSEDDPVGTV